MIFLSYMIFFFSQYNIWIVIILKETDINTNLLIILNIIINNWSILKYRDSLIFIYYCLLLLISTDSLSHSLSALPFSCSLILDLDTYMPTSLSNSLSHSLSTLPFSRSLILDLDTYMPTSLPDLITSASCVRSCNCTTQDGSTMTITTFLKKKISRFELCVAISPLIGHVEKKWKYFYNIIRPQAIDCA